MTEEVIIFSKDTIKFPGGQDNVM